MRSTAFILGILLTISIAGAQTQPAEDAPAPAAMAPTYISIGQELLLRVTLIRRTLDDLKLAPEQRKSALALIGGAEDEVRSLLAKVEAGQMPPQRMLLSVPADLRAAHAKLLAILGPEQSDLLQEKLRSLRGEARAQIAWLGQHLSDLHLSKKIEAACRGILADAAAGAEKLPDCEVEGDAYASARQAMKRLLAMAHDDLAKVLSAADQETLGPRFAELREESKGG
jgi:hypothetical protein